MNIAVERQAELGRQGGHLIEKRKHVAEPGYVCQ